MCKSAGTIIPKGDRPENCPACLNFYLWDLIPTRDQQIHMAKLQNHNFDDLPTSNQEEEIQRFIKFPLIPSIYSIRFRSLYQRLDLKFISYN